MRVFKFGGGVIKDSASVKKLRLILAHYPNESIIVVMSAINKTTNQLEKLISEYLHNRDSFYISFREIKVFHQNIICELGFKNCNDIELKTDQLFEELNSKFEQYKHEAFSLLYDQVVCYGELLSSHIISAYLTDCGINNTWIDARDCIKTDENFRAANVNQENSIPAAKTIIESIAKDLIITQGFIGSTHNGLSTTLGREGSDYTASLLGNFMNVDKVVVWKDVKGVYNADPKHFNEAQLIPALSYADARHLTLLGAKVLHYKSILPLEKLEIPLEVREFEIPVNSGTIIQKSAESIKHIPIIIHRFNKVIIKVRPKSQEGISVKERNSILDLVKNEHLEINFESLRDRFLYICLNHFPEPILQLIVKLSPEYHLELLDQVVMIKIENGNQQIISSLIDQNKIIHNEVKDNLVYLFQKL